jgi:hypothetical protein
MFFLACGAAPSIALVSRISNMTMAQFHAQIHGARA